MSTEKTKDLVRRLWYEELWDKRNIDVADVLFAPNYQLHISGRPAPVDREGIKQVIRMYDAAFPDFHHTIEEIVEEGRTVAARWTLKGTHRGEFRGISPTGKQVAVSGITIHHVASGKIVESWLVFDALSVLQQLGAVPARA